VADVSRRSPPAFVASASFGALGLALLLLAVVTSIDALAYAGVAAGTASLVSALVWREQLIMAWHARMGRRGPG
jgi:hypothetical protein